MSRPTRTLALILVTALAVLGVFGCDQTPSIKQLQVNKNHSQPVLVDVELTVELTRGKITWEANCKLCHQPGLAHAPRIGDQKQWGKRVAKGMGTLIRHAVEGFNEMPARGANDQLSDVEVEWAVRYMVARSI